MGLPRKPTGSQVHIEQLRATRVGIGVRSAPGETSQSLLAFSGPSLRLGENGYSFFSGALPPPEHGLTTNWE